MKNLAKLIVISVVGVLGLAVIIGSTSCSKSGAVTSSSAAAIAPIDQDKTIPKSFVLSADSLDEHGDVAFDHDSHAFKPYSPDGKSVMGCVECHHTCQSLHCVCSTASAKCKAFHTHGLNCACSC